MNQTKYIKRKVRMDHYSGPVLIDVKNFHIVAEGNDEIKNYIEERKVEALEVEDET